MLVTVGNVVENFQQQGSEDGSPGQESDPKNNTKNF